MDTNSSDGGPTGEDRALDLAQPLEELVALAREQARSLRAMQSSGEMDACLLEKISQILCLTANETHQQAVKVTALEAAFQSFLEMYKYTNPSQALQLERFEKMRAEMDKCCPPGEKADLFCKLEQCLPHGGVRAGDGYSFKSRGYVDLVEVSEEHEDWEIEVEGLNESDESLPQAELGPFVGYLTPANQTPMVMDFRSGNGALTPGGQAPVTFRTFTESGVVTGLWPPDMSGAKGGDVVIMSGNLWLKYSTDSGKTFNDLDFTKLFAKEGTYGGWNGDQVIQYVPQIDCFVLYVQSNPGPFGTKGQGKSVVKVALASPADIKKYKGGKPAWWRQWDFPADTFALNAWLDFPDISFGDNYLYINTNSFTRTFIDAVGNFKDTFAGKLFFELPLKEMQAGKGFSFYYGVCTDNLVYGSPTQNIGDTNYWAAHVGNSAMRIYSSKGGDVNYEWRERNLLGNWPLAVLDSNNFRDVISLDPNSVDWISVDHRIIGATKVNNQLWFAWTAANGQGGYGGVNFPRAHIQIAKFDLNQDYKCIDQTQVWNPDIAFAYPSLTTNSNFEVGISLAWGGGKSYGSHAVGILGDFVVWFGEASDRTSTHASPTRFGDYLHVRLAYPDTRFFSAFGYSVLTDNSVVPPEKDDYLYVEFGREAGPAQVVR